MHFRLLVMFLSVQFVEGLSTLVIVVWIEFIERCSYSCSVCILCFVRLCACSPFCIHVSGQCCLFVLFIYVRVVYQRYLSTLWVLTTHLEYLSICLSTCPLHALLSVSQAVCTNLSLTTSQRLS